MKMRVSIFLVGTALALASPAVAAPGSLSDFRLPTPSPSAAEVDRQGPVAPDVPESRTPAPEPTPRATPSPPPLPVEAPPLVLPVPPAAAPTVVTPRIRPSTASPSPAASPQSTDETPVDQPAPPTDAPPSVPLPVPTADASPSAPPVALAQEDAGTPWGWWALAGALLLALGGGAAWLLRRQRGKPGGVVAPQIEKPRVAPPPPEPPAEPEDQSQAAPATPREPLQLALEPLRLSLTLLNATLTYRLEVSNRGLAPLENLRIEADMISAHASMSREQQLAGPGEGAPSQHLIEHLGPGESRIVQGEFRVPFPQIVPIRQGNAALLLPLARFRARAEGAAPVVRTFAVGQPGTSGLQPFRLDQGPRVYPRLVQRAFA